MKMLLEVDISGIIDPIVHLCNDFLVVFVGLGVILMIFGIFTLVTTMDGHDNAQKLRSILMFAAGILLASSKAVLIAITNIAL